MTAQTVKVDMTRLEEELINAYLRRMGYPHISSPLSVTDDDED